MPRHKLLTIAQEWDHFATEIFGADPVNPVQWQEMRRAFYAGYLALLTTCHDVIGAPDLPAMAGVHFLENRLQEAQKFFRDVAAGRKQGCPSRRGVNRKKNTCFPR